MSTSDTVGGPADVVDHVGFGQAEGRRAKRVNVTADDQQMAPRPPHPSMSLVLQLPPPLDAAAAAAAADDDDAAAAANNDASSSAFADGELRAGKHFNALLWDPVASARFLDDRPWWGLGLLHNLNVADA
jgi:hypothetical protein